MAAANDSKRESVAIGTADEAQGRAIKAPRRPWRGSVFIATVLSLIAVAVIASWAALSSRWPSRVRIATGPRGGTFLPMGREFARVFHRAVPQVRFDAIESPGGSGNLRRLESGEVALALVPNDVPAGARVRVIAPLFNEVLHVIVDGSAGVTSLRALRGQRVAIGPTESGTDRIARMLLAHFGLTAVVHAENMAHLDAVGALERHEIAALFALSGLRAQVIERALSISHARLLSLADPSRPGNALDGFRVAAPFATASVIPEGTYGTQPEEPVGTVGVRALLVSRDDVPASLVREITRALFENKVDLAQRFNMLAALSERFDAGEVQFPVHAGASEYFTRHEPPFIVAWADTISLAITVVLLLWSAVAAVRGAVGRSRKQRVDAYYGRVQNIASALDDADDIDELRSVRSRLLEVRRTAFQDLIAGRLDANESFTIFQDYLRSELLVVDAAIRDLLPGFGARASLPPPAVTDGTEPAASTRARN